jgi:Mrp family chromosome partitioning ATPase
LTTTDEPTLHDIFVFLKNGLLFALLIGLAAAVAVYFLSLNEPPTYQASARLLASQADPNLKQFNLAAISSPPIDFAAYTSIALSRPLLEQAKQVAGSTFDDIKFSVKLEEMRVSSFITLTSRGTDPQAVVVASNTLAATLVDWDKQRAGENLAQIVGTLQQQTVALKEQLLALQASGVTPESLTVITQQLSERETQLNFARTLSSSGVGLLEMIEPAVVSPVPVAPYPLRRAALAFVLGLVLGYGVLLLRRAFDASIGTRKNLQRLAKLPLLGDFPNTKNQDALRNSALYLKETVKTLVTDEHPILMVTSPKNGDTKSLVALWLALSFARSGKRTLLVDANLFAPRLTKQLNLKYNDVTTSLASHLQNPEQSAATVQWAANPNLSFIPNLGVPNADLPDSNLATLLCHWQKQYDVTVLDTTPLFEGFSATHLLQKSSMVIPVVNLKTTSQSDLQEMLMLFKHFGIPVKGLVQSAS